MSREDSRWACAMGGEKRLCLFLRHGTLRHSHTHTHNLFFRESLEFFFFFFLLNFKLQHTDGDGTRAVGVVPNNHSMARCIRIEFIDKWQEMALLLRSQAHGNRKRRRELCRAFVAAVMMMKASGSGSEDVSSGTAPLFLRGKKGVRLGSCRREISSSVVCCLFDFPHLIINCLALLNAIIIMCTD